MSSWFYKNAMDMLREMAEYYQIKDFLIIRSTLRDVKNNSFNVMDIRNAISYLDYMYRYAYMNDLSDRCFLKMKKLFEDILNNFDEHILPLTDMLKNEE